jgi:hypothetical protein
MDSNPAMATGRMIRDAGWELLGFPNPFALDRAISEARSIGLLRQSKRGGGANQLNARELVVIALLRAATSAVEIKMLVDLRLIDLKSQCSSTTLSEALEAVVKIAAAGLLEGHTPCSSWKLTISRKSQTVWAEVSSDSDGAKLFVRDTAAPPTPKTGVVFITVIEAKVLSFVVSAYADTLQSTTHQSNRLSGSAASKSLERPAGRPRTKGFLSLENQGGQSQSHSTVSRDFGKPFVESGSVQASANPPRKSANFGEWDEITTGSAC